MREIKFRAWDKRRQRMRHGCDNLLIGLGGQLFWQFGDSIDIIDSKERNTFELMQYTGLKDKQGKEIYEGDIITGRLTLENDDNYDFTDIVSCEPPCFLCDNNADFELTQYQTLEVIGNVWENPELVL